ncbi:MAG: hypothetical protein ACPL7B_02420 [Candidatus Poribacteria bacterium]
MVFLRFSIFCLIVTSIIGFGYYFLASAQENIPRVEIKIEGNPSSGDNVMILEDGVGEKPVQRAFIKSEDGKMIITDIDTEKSDIKRKSNKSDESISKEEKKESKREMRQMDKDKSQKLDMNNKGEKKAQENKQDQSKGQPMHQMPNASQQAPSPQPKGQQPAPNNEGVNLYINAIVNKNLFMPLGWVKREQKASYVLTGVVSNAENINTSKAFIEQAGANKSYYVSPGDTVGDAKVIEIDEWSAKLERSGEQIALKLGEGTRSGAMGGFKGEGQRQRGGGEQKSGGETRRNFQASDSGPQRPGFDASKLPPFVKQMLEERGISIEELQNNPDLQQKLRQELMQRFQSGEFGGRRGGGEMPMPTSQ